MGLPIKQPTPNQVNIMGQFPEILPQLDTVVLNRIPELLAWQNKMTKWYFDFRSVLLRGFDPSQLKRLAYDLQVLSDEFTATKLELINVDIDLQNQINALQNLLGFEWTTAAPVNPWTISHTLKRRPSVTCRTLANIRIFGAESFPDDSTVIVYWGAPIAGSASLN